MSKLSSVDNFLFVEMLLFTSYKKARFVLLDKIGHRAIREKWQVLHSIR